MSKNIVRKEFTQNGSWTCPAGVKKVSVKSLNKDLAIHTYNGGIYLKNLNGITYSSGWTFGTGSNAYYSSPVLVSGGYKFKKILNGVECSFGLDYYGNVYAWGINAGFDSSGFLGTNDNTAKYIPTLISGGRNVSNIFGSSYGYKSGMYSYNRSNFFITTNDGTYAWGTNGWGELGVGDRVSRSSPTLVLGGNNFIQIVCNSNNDVTLFRNYSGDIYSCGYNSKGQLGVGDNVHRSSPTLVVGGYKFRDIIPGQESSCGITKDGDLYSWGSNSFGQLGVGDTLGRSSPTLVVGGYKFKKIEIVGAAILGLTEDGDMYAWGTNALGELGVGDRVSRSSPTLVLGGNRYKDFMFKSSSFVIALTIENDLYAWGNNISGQLGVGDTLGRSSPTLVVGGYKFYSIEDQNRPQYGSSGLSSFTAGTGCVYASDFSGNIYSWGHNSLGQLSLGDVTYRSSPTLVTYFNISKLNGELHREQTFDVVPGTKYYIELKRPTMLGSILVAEEESSLLTIEYEA